MLWVLIMSPTPKGRGHIDFGANPVGVGLSVGIGITLSCLHNML